MDNALYVGLSRQLTLRRQLDIVANNLINANTLGFKDEVVMVGTELGRPSKPLVCGAPVKFVLDDQVARNFTQGAMVKTGGDFDLAIEGTGFFHVQTAAGDRYTRDGRFTTSPEGQLVTEEGATVLDEGGGPIIIDPTLGGVSIGKDGVVTQGAVRVGRLGIVRPDDLTSMAKDGDNLYRNTTNVALQAAPDARVHQGMLESSNVQPVVEITKLIEIQRAYEGVAKMMDNTADLHRTAVERLGKVN